MEKIITFDCYGTLLNTAPLYEYVVNIAKKNNLLPDRAREIFVNYEDRLMYGEEYTPYNELLYHVLEYCDMELVSNVFKKEWNNIIDIHKKFSLYDDVMDALKYLKGQGYELALMSNTIYKIMDCHLVKFENIFDDIILAEDTKCYKPNLLFFKMAEQKFNISEKEHYHIAKGYWWDIVPASKLNWKKIWVNRNSISGREEDLPYKEIKTLSDLKKLL